MPHFVFIATDNFDNKHFSDIKSFVEAYEPLHVVHLESNIQLEELTKLFDVELPDLIQLRSQNFSCYWDISTYSYPLWTDEEFDDFYNSWLNISKRESTMDEYGSLQFIQTEAARWNRLKYRMIVLEQ